MEIGDLPALVAGLASAVLVTSLIASCASSGPPASGPASARTTPTRPEGDPSRAASTTQEKGEPVVRVRLMTEATSLALGGAAKLIIAPDGRPAASKTLATPVTVSRVSTGWLLRDGAGVPHAFGVIDASKPDSLRVKPEGESFVTINQSPYPGEFVLRPRTAKDAAVVAPTPAGVGAPPVSSPVGSAPGEPSAAALPAAAPLAFDVIEHVPVETYLPGVVSRELLPNWSLTAFKAQAVAARTYALHERERSIKNNEPFDLESSQLDQVYGGAVDHAVANRAVRETRGQVLLASGELLRAYYSSTCGGRPASARDVWPTTRGFEFNLAAPIQGSQGPEVACNFSPRFTWSVTRSLDDLSKRLAGFGRDQGLAIRGLKQFARVEPSSTTIEGRPTNYRVFDADGKWYPLSAEQLRNACNWTGSSGRPAVTAQTRVLSGDLEFVIRGSDVAITGRGFGHGVGMCQYGAEGRARAGQTYEQILAHYYPGAVMQQRYR